MTKEEFIERSNNLPFAEFITYDKVVWCGSHKKVILTDVEYGDWQVFPYNRLRGQCHPMRKSSRISKSKSMSRDEFIARAKRVHDGEGLDYSEVAYVNMHTKVKIIDPEYGSYFQEPCVHLKGCGHPLRGIRKASDGNSYTNDEFIDKAVKVWGDQYDFSKVNYSRSQDKVTVICKKHGEFDAYPDALLQGKGCQKCGNHRSDGEDDIYNLVASIIGEENVLRNDRSLLGNIELDIFIPSVGVAIEFDGLRWHSEKFGKDKNYHLGKTLACNEKGVRLIHIFEDEWIYHRGIVISKIRRILRASDGLLRVGARKCKVEEIKGREASAFLSKNHIQGYARSTVFLGAYYGDRLVGAMSFLRCGEGKWELNRFATDIDLVCPGLFSKMFAHFVRDYDPVYVKSFLDRRWGNSEDNVYLSCGFVLDCVVRPSYWYTDGHGKRIHKFGMRKVGLSKKYGFDIGMTEKEMTMALGLDRIWDCGLFKYIWRKEI